MEVEVDEQTTLNLVLIALVVLLGALLIVRAVRERRQASLLRGLSLPRFADLLRTNSLNGSIQDVARKVSDLLIGSFGCERIIFLRRKRRNLELNYFHGLRRFNREDFQFPCRRLLQERLQQGFVPGAIEQIRDLLPESFYHRLNGLNIDTYFPVFWRDNLYGVYFIRSTFATRGSAFNLLVAGLAHSLAAAYHIKWHESRYEFLQKKMKESGATDRFRTAAPRSSGRNILHLVRHHES
ncbi:MAG: hypothetical protein AB1744_15955, partial [Candidatus Zixiibacteriota bacterium]